MASVAICPHCYLQLVVPDDVERDARVECPTCSKAFDLVDAVLRPIPEIRVVERSSISAPFESASALVEPMLDNVEKAERVDDDIAAWFRTQQTVAEVSLDLDTDAVETQPPAEDQAECVEVPMEYEPLARPAATLAELMPSHDFAEPTLGPSFDLPNVPLRPDSSGTIEFDASDFAGPAAATEFALDDVDFEAVSIQEASPDDYAEEANAVTSPAPAQFVIPALPPAKKHRSPLRTLVGAALGGIVGVVGGYLVLLNLAGRQGDFLKVAQYLPDALLPTSLDASRSIDVGSTIPFRPEANDSQPQSEEVSREIAAAYEAQAPPNEATTQPATDTRADEPDRYAEEPVPLEEPPAEPLAIVKPRLTGPTFTVEQLSASLIAAEGAQADMMTGDLSTADARRTKGQSYERLADLAYELTFVDRANPGEFETYAARADTLYLQILSDNETRRQISQIASVWIKSPHRTHGGIFLAGRIRGGQIAGDVYEYTLISETGGSFTLLMPQPLDPLADRADVHLGVVGTIVDQPAEAIAGYSGAVPQALWIERIVPLK